MDNRSQVEEIAASFGSVLLPDNATWTNRFEIKSTSSGKRYVIAQRKTDGVWGCGCIGWTHHRHCKHLVQVLRPLAALAEGRNLRLLKTGARVYDASVGQMLASAQEAFRCLDLDDKEIKVKHRSAARMIDLD